MARATLARLQGKISELELQKFDLGIARRTGKK
jgi:ubiquinone biosynthesis protein UbiJ